MKKTLFIKNTIILTVTSLLLRFAGIIFKIWLAAAIGSEGIGLYQLIFSVYVLASTFATSGIITAVTRLISEELALGSKGSVLKILKRSVLLSLIIAFLSLLAVFLGADFIALRLLEDSRAAAAIKILGLALPFMAISSCFKGYFIARRKITPNAVSQIFEQAVRIILILLLVKKFIHLGLSAACAAVMLGDILAEAVGCLILSGCFSWDKRKLALLSGRKQSDYPVVKKILDISVPITSGRYLNSLLRTAENILVPKNLAKYAASSDNALSLFGTIKGMALPILFFPSALLGTISTLLIPEVSEAAVKKRDYIVKYTSECIIKLTALVSFIFAAIFFVAGREIGTLVYKEDSVGELLRTLSPIVPLMYLDSVCDGILKGLDQQKFTFKTSLSDSAIRIVLVLLILPLFGLNGFIGIMYFSNMLTCFLNVGRVVKLTKAKIKLVGEVFLPLLSAVAVTLISNLLIRSLWSGGSLVYIILLCSVSISSYAGVLFAFKTVTLDEIKSFTK